MVRKLAMTILPAWAMTAQAVTVTFDELVIPGTNPTIAVGQLFESYEAGGFRFSPLFGHMHQLTNPDTCDCTANGTRYLHNDDPSPIVMTATGGDPFTLEAFDGAELFVGNIRTDAARINAEFIDVVGFLAGGGRIAARFRLDGIRDGRGGVPDFESFLLPAAFTDLARVEFSGSAPGDATRSFSIDNVVAQLPPDPPEVPEPPSLALLLAALVPWAGSRVRRHRSRVAARA